MMKNEMSSGNLMADKRAEYARMLVESGDFQAAAELMQQALELAPGWTAGWFQAGGYFEKAGNKEQASKAFELVLRASATDIFGARLKLAHMQGQSVDAPQTAYVEALFDEYAAKFDTSLVENLATAYRYCFLKWWRDICPTSHLGAVLILAAARA
jgi:predicted TPR repeat methyltransferase